MYLLWREENIFRVYFCCRKWEMGLSFLVSTSILSVKLSSDFFSPCGHTKVVQGQNVRRMGSLLLAHIFIIQERNPFMSMYGKAIF